MQRQRDIERDGTRSGRRYMCIVGVAERNRNRLLQWFWYHVLGLCMAPSVCVVYTFTPMTSVRVCEWVREGGREWVREREVCRLSRSPSHLTSSLSLSSKHVQRAFHILVCPLALFLAWTSTHLTCYRTMPGRNITVYRVLWFGRLRAPSPFPPTEHLTRVGLFQACCAPVLSSLPPPPSPTLSVDSFEWILVFVCLCPTLYCYVVILVCILGLWRVCVCVWVRGAAPSQGVSAEHVFTTR